MQNSFVCLGNIVAVNGRVRYEDLTNQVYIESRGNIWHRTRKSHSSWNAKYFQENTISAMIAQNIITNQSERL